MNTVSRLKVFCLSSKFWLGGIMGLLVAYAMIVHLRIIVDSRPIEYREGAQLYLVRELQRGVNIYDFKNQPNDVNVYGIAYHKLASMVTPGGGLSYQPQRILTAIFIFSGCVVMFLMFNKGRLGVLTALIAACVWHSHTLHLWGICGRPDAMAALLYFCAVFLPWKLGFSRASIAFSAICSLLAFFTKPYFAAGIIFVFIYLVNRRRFMDAIYSSVIFAALFISSVILANHYGNAYFYDTLFVNLGYGGGWHWEWILNQVVRFVGINLPLAACVAYAVYSDRCKGMTYGEIVMPPSSCTEPIMDLRYLILSGCCATLILLKIAQNKGSHEYFLHLLSPIFLVGAYKFLEMRGRTTLALTAGVFQLAVLVSPFPDFHEKEWNAVKATIANERSVMQSPTTVHLALARDETVFDSGQTEFFRSGLAKGAKYYPQASGIWDEFQTDLRQRIERQEFSLVLINAKMPAIIDRGELGKHYRLSGTLPAPLYRHRGNVLELWRPIDSP